MNTEDFRKFAGWAGAKSTELTLPVSVVVYGLSMHAKKLGISHGEFMRQSKQGNISREEMLIEIKNYQNRLWGTQSLVRRLRAEGADCEDFVFVGKAEIPLGNVSQSEDVSNRLAADEKHGGRGDSKRGEA
jgi:hypothetical protein